MKQAVFPKGIATGGPYSPAVIGEGRFVYVAGQGPMKDGRFVLGSIEDETALVLDNIKAILEACGATMNDVVRCGVFLANLDDFGRMNEVYKKYFPGDKPARTTVGAALLMGIKIEVDCVAVLPDGKGKQP
jgi:2-iminobutanoate/2-iminopropanoate deaminase